MLPTRKYLDAAIDNREKTKAKKAALSEEEKKAKNNKIAEQKKKRNERYKTKRTPKEQAASRKK